MLWLRSAVNKILLVPQRFYCFRVFILISFQLQIYFFIDILSSSALIKKLLLLSFHLNLTKGATSMHYAVLTASSQSIKILLLYNVTTSYCFFRILGF
ncbi:hypothetical protein ACSQ67_025608 [Phaseolus vulgaris]